MGFDPCQLHVAFFPLMAPGHTIPVLDLIRVFTSHNVETTVITTTFNAPTITKYMDGTNTHIEILPFPTEEVGLPQGTENWVQLTSSEAVKKFMNALQLLQNPLENFLETTRPHCLIADMLFPFATDSAAKFGIPRIVFHGTCFFSLCAMSILVFHKPHMLVSSSDDNEYFLLPNLPHEVRLTRLQLSPEEREGKVNQVIVASMESDLTCFGSILNTFRELEPDYADYYRKVMGRRRAWHVGPVSLCNRDNFKAKSQRGQMASISEHECLEWLNSKEPASVVYVCFGSLNRFSNAQLYEIAMALEAANLPFIWVVKKGNDEDDNWLPNGFEKRVKGNGLLIRGWAPQVLILDHQAIGGFVTHCGWNSILEGISSGVPLVTWPVFAEQFLNDKLVTEILKVGVPIGHTQWSLHVEASVVKWVDIEGALRKVMVGEENLEMRNRAKKLKEMACKAVEEGGSSYSNLTSVVKELRSYHHLDHC